MYRLEQATESEARSAFEDQGYTASARMEPLNIPHVYSLPSEITYVSAGLQAWNPYLQSISINESTRHGYDPSYSLDLSTDLVDDAVASPGGVQGPVAWSLGLRDYQQHPEVALGYPTGTEMHSANTVQHPAGYQVHSYGHRQLLPGQQYHYQDVGPALISPGARSSYSSCESQPSHLAQMTREDLIQQNEELHRQSASHLLETTRSSSIGGIKHDIIEDCEIDQLPESVRKRRAHRRTSHHTSNKPVLVPIDTWTPPTPATFQTSQSSSSAASVSVSPQRATRLSIVDTRVAARRDLFDSRPSSRLVDSNNGDDSDSAEVALSPTGTATPLMKIFSSISSSPETIVSSTVLSTPTSYHPSKPAALSFSSVSSVACSQRQQLHQRQQQQQQQHHHHLQQEQQQQERQPRLHIHSSRSSIPTVKATSTTDKSADPDPTPRPAGRRRTDQKARNRVAATKCRLKTKAAMLQLEVEERAASERNADLLGTVARLREEQYMLRELLLLHTDCDCQLIQQYLSNRARELAEDATRRANEAGGRSMVGRRGEEVGKEAVGSDDNYDDGSEEDEDD